MLNVDKYIISHQIAAMYAAILGNAQTSVNTVSDVVNIKLSRKVVQLK